MSEPESRTHRENATVQVTHDAEREVEVLVEGFLEQLQAGATPDRAALVRAVAAVEGRRFGVRRGLNNRIVMP